MARERQQTPLRLTPDHLRRVDKAAEHCGQTRQSFMQAAILAEVAEVEERMRMKQLRVRPTMSDPTPHHEIDPSTTPVGIGISSRRRQEIAEAPSTPLVQTSPVHVHVGNGTSSGGPSSSVDSLATYVVNGNDFSRDTRLRTAVEILSASAATDEERRVLAARLDEAVAAKSKAPAVRGGDNGASGVVKAARFAYEKFSDFWNE